MPHDAAMGRQQMTTNQLAKLLRSTRDPILRASLQHRLHVALRRASRASRRALVEETIAVAAGTSKPWLAVTA
jgi:hypothetical protein